MGNALDVMELCTLAELGASNLGILDHQILSGRVSESVSIILSSDDGLIGL